MVGLYEQIKTYQIFSTILNDFKVRQFERLKVLFMSQQLFDIQTGLRNVTHHSMLNIHQCAFYNATT